MTTQGTTNEAIVVLLAQIDWKPLQSLLTPPNPQTTNQGVTPCTMDADWRLPKNF